MSDDDHAESDRRRSGRPGPMAKCLLALIIGMALLLVALSVYLYVERPGTAVRGQAGPLAETPPK